MKWPGRFTDALANATEVFNYYSSGDAVFTEVDGIPDLLDDVVHWDGGFDWFWYVIPYPELSLAFENHCWQKQEVLKGMFTPAGTTSGGWGFYVGPSSRYYVYDPLTGRLEARFTPGPSDRSERFYVLDHANCALVSVSESELTSVYHVSADSIALARLTTVPPSTNYPVDEAERMVSNGSVTNRPIFDVSGATEMMNHDAPDEDVFLALAKHVPALSSPVGGNAVLGHNRDFNLNSDDFRNGWGRNHSVFEDSWLHSDMKDMAFFYVYKLYEQLVQKGRLK